MIKNVIINGISYDVDEGLSLQDKATEELDSMTFSISNISEFRLEPFQKVEITFENDKKKNMIVNTWIEEVASIYGFKRYTINCISETKKLERVQLPNLTITQPLGGTKRKYDRYLNRTMKYVNKIYPELYISDDLLNRMSNEIAVEEQFNSPNYKEYLNSILGKSSLICKVENDEISYFDLSIKGKEIDSSKILFTNESQMIEDYYSSIRTDLQGVQSEKSTIFTEVVGVRSPENAVITYDNAVIRLSHNINYIDKVYFRGVVTEDIYKKEVRCKIFDKNDSNLKTIREKTEYDTLLVSNATEISEKENEYKRNNVYYTRGSNLIEGLGYNEKTWFLGLNSLTNALENVVEKGVKISGQVESDKPLFLGDMRDFCFEVTYSALDDVSTEFDKKKTTMSVIRDNQSDSYVDLDKFARVQQEKINRLGNSTWEINARYNSLDEVPELMDYIGDYILAEREIVYHRDYIDFKGILYKDYVKKNLFYGVNAKRRNTQLIMGNEAVTRKELTKEKYKFEFTDKGGDKKFQRYILGNIFTYQSADFDNFKPIQLCSGTSYFEDGSSSNLYKIDADTRRGGNSVFVNFKWYDNINVGMKVTYKETSIINTLLESKGGYGQEYVTYTDNNGEVEDIKISIYDSISSAGFSLEDIDGLPSLSDSIIDSKYLIYENTLERYKDNKEILNETIQFEINCDKDIYITDYFMNSLPFFENSGKKLYVAIFYDNKWHIRTDMSIDTNDLSQFRTKGTTFNRIKVYNNNVDLSTIQSWALVDEDMNIYIAVNRRESDGILPTEIYLNKEE